MRKAIKRLSVGLAVTLIVIASLLPVVVPPIVERVVQSEITKFGLNTRIKAKLDWCWRNGPGLEGSIRISTENAPWCVRATFAVSCCEWAITVKMAETAFDESDPTIVTLLKRFPLTDVTNLVFSGSIALNAQAERTFGMPVPVWSVKLPIRDLAVSASIGDKAYAISGLYATPAASGISDHLDIAPMFLRARSCAADGFALTNLTASVRASEKALLVTEAAADVCGGKVSLYSLFLDPTTLNTGFTLFVDDVDSGEVLRHFNGFHGEASGRLHGKVKLFVKDGGMTLRLSDAFLYSTPGEVGKLQMADATPVTDNLALAGIDEETRTNVANALNDLDYSVLRLNLRRGSGKDATLSVKLSGTATRGELSVPVNLTLNFNGELEQIINTGLKLTSQP